MPPPSDDINPCVPSPCGANAECKARNGVGSCTCLLEYYGDPYTGCRPECVQNSECDRSKACINNKCKDPCPGVCGVNASKFFRSIILLSLLLPHEKKKFAFAFFASKPSKFFLLKSIFYSSYFPVDSLFSTKSCTNLFLWYWLYWQSISAMQSRARWVFRHEMTQNENVKKTKRRFLSGSQNSYFFLFIFG